MSECSPNRRPDYDSNGKSSASRKPGGPIAPLRSPFSEVFPPALLTLVFAGAVVHLLGSPSLSAGQFAVALAAMVAAFISLYKTFRKYQKYRRSAKR